MQLVSFRFVCYKDHFHSMVSSLSLSLKAFIRLDGLFNHPHGMFEIVSNRFGVKLFFISYIKNKWDTVTRCQGTRY